MSDIDTLRNDDLRLDIGHQLMLADAYEEAGDPDRSEAMRWLAAKKRAPICRTGDYQWWSDRCSNPPKGSDDLPWVLIRQHFVEFATYLGALDFFLNRWCQLTREKRDDLAKWVPPLMGGVCRLCNGSGFPGTTERTCQCSI